MINLLVEIQKFNPMLIHDNIPDEIPKSLQSIGSIECDFGNSFGENDSIFLLGAFVFPD